MDKKIGERDSAVPCRPNEPAWRSALAEKLATGAGNPGGELLDAAVQDASAYLRLVAEADDGPKRAAKRFPATAAVYCLHGDAEAAGKLKILSVAPCGLRQIATQMRLDPSVVDAWRRLFFDLPRRPHPGWVDDHVVVPEENAGNHQLAAQLRLAAAVGPVAAVAILVAPHRVPLKEGATLFKLKCSTHARETEAVLGVMSTFAGNFKSVSANLKRQQRVRREERCLAERCNKILQRAELARFRREVSADRANRRAEKTKAKQEERELWSEGNQRMREFKRLPAWRRYVLEQEAAEARAAASPLAQLRWAEPNFGQHDKSHGTER